MTEYEMMVNMLQRINYPDYWYTNASDHTITLVCNDEWYNTTFVFNEKGELVSLD